MSKATKTKRNRRSPSLSPKTSKGFGDNIPQELDHSIVHNPIEDQGILRTISQNNINKAQGGNDSTNTPSPTEENNSQASQSTNAAEQGSEGANGGEGGDDGTANEIAQAREQLETVLNTSAEEIASARQAAAQAQQEAEGHQSNAEALQASLDEANARIAQLEENSQATQEQAEENEAENTRLAELSQEVNDIKSNLMKLSGLTAQQRTQPSATSMFQPGATFGSGEIGAYKDLVQAYHASQKWQKYDSSNNVILGWDRRDVRQALASMSPKEIQHLYRDMYKSGQSFGLFRNAGGVRPLTHKQATTVVGDIAPGYLETLSELALTTNEPTFIHHLILWQEMRMGAGLGTVTNIRKHNRIPDASVEGDVELSDGTTYSDIGASNQAHTTGTIKVPIKEYGLDTPVSLSAFVEATSMVALLDAIAANLLRHHYSIIDLLIRNRLNLTSLDVYNNNGTVAGAAADLVDGSGGRATAKFLANLYAYAYSQTIEPLPDQSFALILPSIASGHLAADFAESDKGFRPGSLELYQEFTDMMRIPQKLASGRGVFQNMAKIQNFWLLCANSYGGGIAGTEGVMNLTTGATTPTQLARASYLVGNQAVLQVMAEDFQLHVDDITNFQRRQEITHYAYYGIKDTAVDPAGTGEPDQEGRVLRFWATDNEL